MLVLIDESGCPGFKIVKGSTPYFVLAMVIFHDLSIAETVSKEISTLRESLGIKPEFKFSKCRRDFKDQFFTAVCRYDFSIRSVVVNKSCIYEDRLRLGKENFYNFFLKKLMQNASDVFSQAKVKLDGTAKREFQRSMKTYLRQQLQEGKIKEFKFIDSKKDNLIQLADMVVGAIARSYNKNRNDRSRWKNSLEKKIDEIREFT